MGVLLLTSEQVAQVSGLVAQYIAAQREVFLPRAVPLTAVQRAAMSGFFAPQLLDGIRVCGIGWCSGRESIVLPDADGNGDCQSTKLRRNGRNYLCDAVVSHEPFTDGLLFHELVHAVQYEKLGLAEFAAKYVRGFLSGGSYEVIPLEMNALELDARFARAPTRTFSIEAEVGAWIDSDRL